MALPIYTQEETKQMIVIAIAAGKGGVGKSTVAVNLARTLQKNGYSVGILDADLYGPSISKMLPLDSPPEQKGEKLLPARALGISIISMGYFRPQHQSVAIRAPIANGMISQFLENVLWGNLDYLIIDFPPGTGDIQLTLCQKANLRAAIMVTTPQDLAILDVRRAMQMFQQLQVPILGVVENMSYFEPTEGGERFYPFGRGGGEKLALEGGVPLITSIPIDPLLGLNTDLERSSAFVQFLELAKTVENSLNISKEPYSFELNWEGSEKHLKFRDGKIREISLTTPHHFCIRWEDGCEELFRLSDLQKHCPCAACSNSPPIVDSSVRGLRLLNVGSYAMKVIFSSGCSHGIYSYDMLHSEGNTRA